MADKEAVGTLVVSAVEEGIADVADMVNVSYEVC